MVPTSQHDVPYFASTEKQPCLYHCALSRNSCRRLKGIHPYLIAYLTEPRFCSCTQSSSFKLVGHPWFPHRHGQNINTTTSVSAWKTEKLKKGLKIGYISHCPQWHCQSGWSDAHSQGDGAKSGTDGARRRQSSLPRLQLRAVLSKTKPTS